MSIAALITQGIGPGGSVLYALTGGLADVTVAGDYYGVQSRGRGRKRRYYIELDGRQIFGRRLDLERILQSRAKPLPLARAVPPAGPQPTPAPVQPAAAPLPEFKTVDLEAYRAAKEQEAARLRMENDAIALLLLTP